MTAPPLRAQGRYCPPAGRRRLPAVIVLACPVCQHMHVHRVASWAASWVKAPSCQPGTRYVVALDADAPAPARRPA